MLNGANLKGGGGSGGAPLPVVQCELKHVSSNDPLHIQFIAPYSNRMIISDSFGSVCDFS